MDQYNSISIKHSSANRSPAINRAEEAVTNSLERFEHAMQTLAERVEESRIRVESAVEQVNKARTEVTRIKDSVVATVEPFRGYADSAMSAYSTARENPKPYLFSILGVVGALLAWTYYSGRQETPVYDTTLEVHPTYQ